jgi:hypothetical protein
MPSINIPPKFEACPICLGTSFEAQAFNSAGSLIESQQMDAPCFVCNGAKVVSPDAICICGRAATWQLQEGSHKDTLYCGRLGCLKRVQQGESATSKTFRRWKEGEDDPGKDDDYSHRYPFRGC